MSTTLAPSPSPSPSPSSPAAASAVSSAVVVQPPAFERLRRAIEEAAAQRAALQAFLEHIEPLDQFDSQDTRQVQRELLAAVRHETHLRDVLSKREHLFNTQLVTLQRDLAARHQVLSQWSQASDAFDRFPALTQHFAARETQLAHQVERIRGALESDWSAEP